MADAFDGRRRAQGRIGAVIKDKWRIDARLGTGGMATVYAATHRNGNRVAIKMLNLDFSRDPSVRARFLREGYVANAVGHAGAVKVLDDDIAEDGCAFLVMELLEGESLEARRERVGGKLPVEEVFTVGDQLLDLLAAAHPKGIIHRDIKPENVFVTHDGSVKLLDFGIARMRQAGDFEQNTGTGLMMGTPDFMSPEQATGRPDAIDARSDLWSLGATMFTLLSGESVHVSDNLREHLMATATRPARSLMRAAPGLMPQLVTVVDRALELDKTRRWPDARAMQEALRWAYKSLAFTDVPSSGESVTVHMAMPSEILDEATRVEPMSMSMDAVSDATIARPPSDAKGYPREVAPPPAPRTPIPTTAAPGTLAPPTPMMAKPSQPQQPVQVHTQRHIVPQPMPQARPAELAAPVMQPPQPPQPQPQPQPQPRAPGWYGQMPHEEAGSAPQMNPHYFQPTPGPQRMPQSPSTLGAQFTDPRQSGSGTAPNRGRGRLVVVGLVVLIVALGVLTTLLLLSWTRASPSDHARAAATDSGPMPSGAVPPGGFGAQPPGADAGATK